MSHKSRPYQVTAVANVIEAFQAHTSAMVVMPTGCVSAETIIGVNRAGIGSTRTIESAYLSQFDRRRNPSIPTMVRSVIGSHIGLNLATDIKRSGQRTVYKLVLENGKHLTKLKI